jgi:cell division protein ZipA
MDTLRWILLAAGAVLMLGIYVWGWRVRRREPAQAVEQWSGSNSTAAGEADEDAAPSPPRNELSMPRATTPSRRDPLPVVESMAAARAGRHTALARREPTLGAAHHDQDDVELPSMAAQRGPLQDGGADIGIETEPRIDAAPTPRLQKIITVRVTAPAPSRFEGLSLLEQGRPIFSIASLLEPGTFSPATMLHAAYPGVALFAVLPGPVSGHHALDDLMATARSLADRLGGNLLDDRGAMLSVQRMAQIREEITAFERRLPAARGA